MIRCEPNARIHLAVALIVIAVGFCLRLPPRDWAVIVLAIGGVVVTEAMNTAVERTVDLACPNHHPLAKIGKDVAAAAVLMAAMIAVVIGLLILGPALWERAVTHVEDVSMLCRSNAERCSRLTKQP